MKKDAYAVIFSNRLRENADGYEAMKDRMLALAEARPGYLGHIAFRDEAGEGVTISYWETEEAVAAWRANAEHREAQRVGRAQFYAWFRLEVCRIERLYGFDSAQT